MPLVTVAVVVEPANVAPAPVVGTTKSTLTFAIGQPPVSMTSAANGPEKLVSTLAVWPEPLLIRSPPSVPVHVDEEPVLAASAGSAGPVSKADAPTRAAGRPARNTRRRERRWPPIAGEVRARALQEGREGRMVPAGMRRSSVGVARSSSLLSLGQTAQMLQRASVGDMRAARRAGTRPATAPITRAAPKPPAQASGGTSMSQPFVVA